MSCKTQVSALAGCGDLKLNSAEPDVEAAITEPTRPVASIDRSDRAFGYVAAEQLDIVLDEHGGEGTPILPSQMISFQKLSMLQGLRNTGGGPPVAIGIMGEAHF